MTSSFVTTSDGRKLVRRGTDTQTILAHDLNLHEYVWPRICGEDQRKWQAVADFIDRAARKLHDHCSSFDGRRTIPAPHFSGDHADSDRSAIRHYLVSLIEAGIPRFLTESDS